MKTVNSVLLFVLKLLIILTGSFFAHAYLQDRYGVGFYENQLVLCYAFNFVLTLVFFSILTAFIHRNKSNTGFVFLYSSLIKFLLFFIFIYPGYENFNGVRSPEFASFFVPYALSISLEIYYLIRLLNK